MFAPNESIKNLKAMKKFSDLNDAEKSIHQRFIKTLLDLARFSKLHPNVNTTLYLHSNSNEFQISFKDKKFYIKIDDAEPEVFNPTAITGIMSFIKLFEIDEFKEELNNFYKNEYEKTGN